MDEYIKREDALNAIKAIRSVCGCSAIDRDDAENAIMDCLTADVVPRAELAVRSFQDAATIYDLQKKLVVATETLRYIRSDLKKKIHDRAVYPHNSHIDPYISLKAVDAIIEKEISHAKGGG
jgi:hypothetical protein